MYVKYMHAFLHDNVKIKIYNTRVLENPLHPAEFIVVLIITLVTFRVGWIIIVSREFNVW